MQKRREASKKLFSKARAIQPFKKAQPRIVQVYRWKDGRWNRENYKDFPLKRERFPGPGTGLKPVGKSFSEVISRERGRIGEVEVKKIREDLFYLTGETGFFIVNAEKTSLLLVQLEKGNFQGLLGKYEKRDVVGGKEVHKFTPMKKSEALETLKRLQRGDKLPPSIYLKYFFHK